MIIKNALEEKEILRKKCDTDFCKIGECNSHVMQLFSDHPDLLLI